MGSERNGGGGEGKGRMGKDCLEWSVKKECPSSRFQTLALGQVNGLVNDGQEHCARRWLKCVTRCSSRTTESQHTRVPRGASEVTCAQRHVSRTRVLTHTILF